MTPRQFHIHGQTPLGDRHVTAARTRFIPSGLLPHFEQTSWPPVSAAADLPLASTGAAVKARILGMWQSR
jgi:DNA helicase-2/ATP-dependent DNA helicase PcrA